MKRLLIAAAVLALSTAAPAAFAAEPETYGFQFSPGDDNCMVKYPRADGLTLSYMLFKNYLLISGVVKDKWSIVDGQAAGAGGHKLTFDYGGGTKTTTASAGYINAEVQGVYGLWEGTNIGPGGAIEALGALNKGQVVTVSFDDKPLGTFDMKMKGFAYQMLKNCVDDLNKKAK